MKLVLPTGLGQGLVGLFPGRPIPTRRASDPQGIGAQAIEDGEGSENEEVQDRQEHA